jgi:NDP-sugar pyrophosphorylase family protein
MPDPTLVILAGGIGSRYGGLKQADPIGPNGELIISYSVYDALRAGFGHVVFLLRRDIEDAFRDRIGKDVERHTKVTYVFQDLDNVPAGFSIPAGRVKPWGTGHAVLCCKDVVRTNFAAINADDFYGATTFRALADYLRTAKDVPGAGEYSMAGYVLSNTLSEYGHVARGVCQVGPDGYLQSIRERLHIELLPDGIKDRVEDGSWVPFPPDNTVSMNMWGFTPSFFGELEARFPVFLAQNVAADPLKAEFLLPNIVGELVQEEKARVKVLPTDEKWFGVTYQADRPRVQAAVRELIAQGRYPAKLWAD